LNKPGSAGLPSTENNARIQPSRNPAMLSDSTRISIANSETRQAGAPAQFVDVVRLAGWGFAFRADPVVVRGYGRVVGPDVARVGGVEVGRVCGVDVGGVGPGEAPAMHARSYQLDARSVYWISVSRWWSYGGIRRPTR